MTPPQGFKTDPNRDATDSIRGYVYQVYQSVLAWMNLKENEILVLEGAEDFDIHCGSSITTTQVKDTSDNLTLRSLAIIDSINNYWVCHKANPNYDIILHFLSTAKAGCEKGSPFGPGKKGLECWNSTELNHIDVKLLKEFLLKLKLNPELISFIKTTTTEDLREKIIRRIKWNLGNRPREALQYIIEDKLKIHGFKHSINSHYSCQALPLLLKRIADLLSTKGKKELRFGDFLSCFDDATTVSIPRGKMEAMTSGNNLQQLTNMFDLAEMSRLTNISTIVGKPMPVVDGCISRIVVVSKLSKLLREQHLIFLCGSSGLGKTNLASLISHQVGENWGWVDFRGLQPEQIRDVLTRVAFNMNSTQLSPFLVLDDVDFKQINLFEREFISLIFSIMNATGMVIITGPVHPTLQLLPKIWKSETCEVIVSYFDETEIAEMVRAHGLAGDQQVLEWARIIKLTTNGHPQLVHARVRNLSAKGWPPIKFSELTKPQDVERVRSEARARLILEIPTETTRILAYRLSLIIGVFSRETAIAVAETPPPSKLPGEDFDALIGPWIESEGGDSYRVSPLLTGAANNVLPEADIKTVHGVIALNIIRRKSINQFEVGTAFFHAFIAKHLEALSLLAKGILTGKGINYHLLYDRMSWFTYVCLEDGQKILPNNPSIELMLRLVQYKLIISSPKPDKSIAVIVHI